MKKSAKSKHWNLRNMKKSAKTIFQETKIIW